MESTPLCRSHRSVNISKPSSEFDAPPNTQLWQLALEYLPHFPGLGMTEKHIDEGLELCDVAFTLAYQDHEAFCEPYQPDHAEDLLFVHFIVEVEDRERVSGRHYCKLDLGTCWVTVLENTGGYNCKTYSDFIS